jgi:hypothetical protein
MLCAALGAAAGSCAASRGVVWACTCFGNGWQLELVSVTSSDAAASHAEFWPEGGLLSVDGERAFVRGFGSVPGQVATLEARR